MHETQTAKHGLGFFDPTDSKIRLRTFPTSETACRSVSRSVDCLVRQPGQNQLIIRG